MAKKRDIKEEILDAFQRSKHRWRTARGLSKDTGISLKDVTTILERSSEFIRSKKVGSRGQALFATRNKRSDGSGTSPSGDEGVGDEETHIGKEKLKYLVMLPMDSSMNRLRDTIQRTIRAENGEPVFLDEHLAPGAAWVDHIAALIGASDAVIADITRMNANVIFELGIARGLKKPLILLLSDDADPNLSLPSDLAGYQYLTYSPSNLSPFTGRLGRMARHLELRRG